MSKPTVTRLFIGSLVAVIGGVVLLVAGLLVALANGALVMSGADVTGFKPSAIGWSTIILLVVALLVTVGGGVGQFVAWIGAVVNTSRLDDKTWFVVLLVLGLLSFGFVAMLVYVLAGPDGTRHERRALQLA